MLNSKNYFILLVTILFTLCFKIGIPQESFEEQSYSTSIVVMTNLIELERSLIKTISDELSHLKKKVDMAKRLLFNILEDQKRLELDAESFVVNPINAFALVRRTHMDWPCIMEFLNKQRFGKNLVMTSELKRIQLPTRKDLMEAIIGIDRIRTYYNLLPLDMAHGLFNDVKYSVRLSAFELFTLGLEFFKLKNFDAAISWLNASLLMDFQTFLPKKISTYDPVNALLLYTKTLMEMERLYEAWEAIQKALILHPKNRRIIKMYEFSKTICDYILPVNEINFERCCREECKERIQSLHCRYNRTTNYYYMLGPIKMEELSYDPYIVIFHDVITDNEIKILKELSANEFHRAKVFTSKGEGATSDFRTAQEAVISLGMILNRLSAITGFNIKGFETPGVINYGIGGHYVAHTDYLGETQDIMFVKGGDRIGTILIYLNDVEQGGATVFPKLNLSVPPKKATVLMWHNMKNNGNTDINSLHGACPVIVGSKWVVTVWVREREQFRNVPCYNN